MNQNLLQSINEKKKKLDQLRPFPQMALEKLHERIVVEWTYNSNAIEGNTLTLKETALILNEGLTISGKSLREHLEAVNHKQAIKELELWVAQKNSLSEKTVLHLHKLILKGISDEDGGIYRRYAVRILGAIHIPPNPLKVQKLMTELFRWFATHRKKIHPVELAALFHYKLVHIHPFIDGNGRSSRLAMNLILMQNGFPPAVILKTDRKQYYRVLQEADQNQMEGFINFIARSVERSLVLYLEALRPQTKSSLKEGYVSLAEAAEGTPYSQEYLSLLARRGILPAIKFQRNWMVTLDSVKKYVLDNKK